jgi:hypothetical protein
MSPALTVNEDEMTTALGLFAEAVADIATEPADRPILAVAEAAGAITGVEAGG